MTLVPDFPPASAWLDLVCPLPEATLAAAPPSMRGGEFAVAAGQFATLDHERAGELGLEFRFAPAWLEIEPLVGITAIEGHGFYGFGGLRYELQLEHDGGFYLAPSFAAGWYERGDARKLGGAVEFRSSLELGFAFEDGWSIGVAFYHISNGGLYDRNGGAESLLLSLSFAADRLLR